MGLKRSIITEAGGRAGLESLQKKEVSFQDFAAAFKVFAGDYGIVGHAGEPTVSIFDEPRKGRGRDHKYTVTTVPEGMTETQFKEKIGDNPVVVIDMCMDARGAVDTYTKLAREAKRKFGSRTVIILISHGGGIIQVDEATRERKKVNLGRKTASSTIYRYLANHSEQIKQIYAGGHDCRCGACAFYNDGVGVPEKLNCEKGSQKEIKAMQDMVYSSALQIVPEKLREKVKLFVAHFTLDKRDSVKIQRDRRDLPISKK
ncbi:MAG: hypothetical protein BroJett025_10330 [Patescibacteria group bacterium]|nr:MAG: hypothetical protein BroJett025_10330 [Patescibacteria group bacterium]